MGLTDYEIRDLNDEINQLLREKRHYETQIVALGGANYKRAAGVMLDDDGKEVPGTRGYKWARQLLLWIVWLISIGTLGEPKSCLESGRCSTKEVCSFPIHIPYELTLVAKAATEESARNASFQKFRNQGTEYYGDNDELDGDLLAEEDELARKGTRTSLFTERLFADTVRLGRSHQSNR